MITRFDHAVIAVRDLDEAIGRSQALGFDVCPGGDRVAFSDAATTLAESHVSAGSSGSSVLCGDRACSPAFGMGKSVRSR
ncbi:MAG TPA: VOC family protein [Ktedonobacteraceae bacterium]